MLVPNPKDAIHKAWLIRVLREFADDSELASLLRFKGGTCAAMLNLIDRFSVDLDFDLIDADAVDSAKERMEKIFEKLGLKIADQSKIVPQYFLKYQGEPGGRNTLRIDVTFPVPSHNKYEPRHFPEIDRVIYCQTPDTMFSNKLVAITERYKKYGSLAGRDIFDVHAFFLKAIPLNAEVVKERTGLAVSVYLKKLGKFIDEKFTQQVIDQDLNHLMPHEAFKKLRPVIKAEVLMFLKDEIARRVASKADKSHLI
jgi:predicted nucleotidyltransferase component of viral defense system